jgi:hypothetical protein
LNFLTQKALLGKDYYTKKPISKGQNPKLPFNTLHGGEMFHHHGYSYSDQPISRARLC